MSKTLKTFSLFKSSYKVAVGKFRYISNDSFPILLFNILCLLIFKWRYWKPYKNMHFIKAYLRHQDLANKKEVKFYISFEMLRDKITKKIFSFLDLFGLNLWWVKKFDPFSGVTILLSLTVFHNIVTEKLPQVSDAMPLLGIIRIILFIETKSFCVCPYFIPSAEWKQTSVHNNASTWKSFHPSSNKKCNVSN